ncbi:hypothetical protein V5P93_004608 [Actinokineospora auranticolor]|uniref:hypothetical protein n=1 Tax=Actinokineospora auranticolor TaxID=155976 RepID=UPI000CEC2A22|nr:hypothetical protein [Actinokineospora auranticolor]
MDDDELREWADCLDLRTRITADPTAVGSAPAAVRFRLLRDYPQHRHLVQAKPALTEQEGQRIRAFAESPFQTKVGDWLDLPLEDQARWMTTPVIASWAAAFRALELFDFNLRGDRLMALLRRLDPKAREFALEEQSLADYLTANSLRI